MNWLCSHFYDRVTESAERACLAAWRSNLLGDCEGRVVEIGAGTGANLSHYGTAVTELLLVEPDAAMRRQLEAKLRRKGLPARVVDAPAETLPFEDGYADALVSTLVLCSVRDLTESLREAHRVLRDGGTLFFIEHVIAEDRPRRARWQRRLEPIWKRVSGNCHLTRDTAQAIRDAGFDVQSLKRESIRKAMPLLRPSIRGVARRTERASPA